MNDSARTLDTQFVSDWQAMPFTLDQGSPGKAAIGLIALANDLTCEPELTIFLPREGVGLYTNRRSGPRILDTPLSESLMHVQAAKTGAA